MQIYWRSIYDINIPHVNSERKSFFSMLNKIESLSFSNQRDITSTFLKENFPSGLAEKSGWLRRYSHT